MDTLKGICFLASLFLASTVLAHPKVLTLKETVEFALGHSLSINSTQKNITIRELEYKNSVAKLLPSLDLLATHGLQNNIPLNSNFALLTPNPTAPWFSSFSLGITENLYDNGASITQINMSRLNQDVSQLTYLRERALLTLDVMTEFYQFSLSNALLDVKKQQRKILVKQFKSLSSQYQQGFKTKLDFLRFKTQLQRAEIDLLNAEKQKELSRIKICQLIGVEPNEKEIPHFDPIVVDRYQQTSHLFPSQPLSIEKFYDFEISKIQEEINDKSISLTVRKYWPQVFLGAGIGYINLNYLGSNEGLFANNQLNWNVLLTLQYNFWDWGIRRRDVEIARLNRDVLSNQMNFNLITTNAKMNSLLVDIERVRENYKLTQDLLSYEEQNYKNVEIQYYEGKVFYLDMINSLNSLLDAKIQFYTNYFQALQLTAKYRYYEGKIYESLL